MAFSELFALKACLEANRLDSYYFSVVEVEIGVSGKGLGFPGGSGGKESAYRTPRFDSWVGKIPWRRKWQPTPVYLPGKSQGQRSLVGYSSWGCKRVRHDLAIKQTRRIQIFKHKIT